MFVIKISQAALDAIGAKSIDEFSDKFVAFIASIKSIEARVEATEASCKALPTEEQIKQIAVAAMPQAPLSEEQIKQIAVAAIPQNLKELAKNEGSRAALDHIGRVGASTPASASPVNSETPSIEALIAEAKFEEAWKADKNAQKEFVDEKSYIAFMKHRDHVRFSKGNQITK